jgi:hypothetical protein
MDATSLPGFQGIVKALLRRFLGVRAPPSALGRLTALKTMLLLPFQQYQYSFMLSKSIRKLQNRMYDYYKFSCEMLITGTIRVGLLLLCFLVLLMFTTFVPAVGGSMPCMFIWTTFQS